jgi:hypothetical protein
LVHDTSADGAGQRWRWDDVGDTAELGLGEADVEVGTERPRQFGDEELTEFRSGDPAHHLSDEVPLVEGVVSGELAGLPPWSLGGEHRGRLFPVVDVLDDDRLGPPGDARCVRQEMANEHIFLTAGGELGPVLGDRSIEVEFAAVDEQQRAQRHHCLGARPHIGDRVPFPRSGARLVSETTPHIDDEFTIDNDRDRSPTIGARGQVGAQDVGHLRESIVACAVNVFSNPHAGNRSCWIGEHYPPERVTPARQVIDLPGDRANRCGSCRSVASLQSAGTHAP